MVILSPDHLFPETSHLPVVQSQVIRKTNDFIILPDDSCLSNPANQVNVVHEHSPLGVLYTNTDQFLNKFDDLLMLIAGNEPDLILIAETQGYTCLYVT